MYVAVFAMSSRGFSKSRAMVTNYMVLSASGFVSIFSKLGQAGIEEFGWRGVMLIAGALVLNLAPMQWIANKYFDLIIDTRANANNEASKINIDPDTEKVVITKWNVFTTSLKKAFDVSLLHDPCFILYCISSACLIIIRALPTIYIARSAQGAGYANGPASTLLSVYFACMAVCAFTMGMLANIFNEHHHVGDKSRIVYLLIIFYLKHIIFVECNFKIKAAYVLIIVPILESFIFLIPVISTEYTALVLYSVLAGSCDGL